MSGPHENAYPQLPVEIDEQQRLSVFTPSQAERQFIANTYRRVTIQVLLTVQLKVVQRLGYFVTLASVPRPIIVHLCRWYRVPAFNKAALQAYEESDSKSIHQRRVREFVGLRPLDEESTAWLEEEARKVAQTKQELLDIFNVLLDELVHHRYELPTFGSLSRMASRAGRVNDAIYKAIAGVLSDVQRTQIDRMFRTQQGRSQWDSLKREPKQPSVREVASFLTHIEGLRTLAAGLPAITDVSVPKKAQFVLEYRALNIREMQYLKPAKRYALAVLLIQEQLKRPSMTSPISSSAPCASSGQCSRLTTLRNASFIVFFRGAVIRSR